MDHLADCVKLCVDLPVGKAEDLNAVPLQGLAAALVMLLALLAVMLGAVDFNHQLSLGAVEIHDLGVDDPLFVDFEGVGADELVPQLVLLGRHVLAQRFGTA